MPRSTLQTSLTAFALSLVLVAPASQAMLLDYTAYLGGAKVGEAKVEIALQESGYEINGRVESAGLLGLFSRFKSLFSLRGIFSSGKPVVREYQVTEKSGNRKKHITYEGDQVHVTRNGEVRSPRPLPAETDLWSFMFLSEDCNVQPVIHDGKDVWQVEARHTERLGDGGHYCEFDLADEDNDRSVASVWLREIGDLMVPVQVRFQGDLQGTFKLTDHTL